VSKQYLLGVLLTLFPSVHFGVGRRRMVGRNRKPLTGFASFQAFYAYHVDRSAFVHLSPSGNERTFGSEG